MVIFWKLTFSSSLLTTFKNISFMVLSLSLVYMDHLLFLVFQGICCNSFDWPLGNPPFIGQNYFQRCAAAAASIFSGGKEFSFARCNS